MNDRSVTIRNVNFMCDFSVPQNDVALRILNAADVLMAKEGVQHLSTHKIAKAAGVSVGTIYLYFKDKEDLLHRLVLYLFHRFQQAVANQQNSDLPIYEQYRQLWHSTWQFMQENPNVVMNMHQYESLPGFQQLMLQCIDSEYLAWSILVKQGKQQKILADLPSYVLFCLAMKPAWHLRYLELISGEPYSDALLEEVILRTWKAIIL